LNLRRRPPKAGIRENREQGLPLMPVPTALIAPAAFALAATLSGLTAWWGAQVIEQRTEAAITAELRREGMTWAMADTDGLQVHLFGTAPSEAQRFRALNLTSRIVDAGRIRDRMDVTPAQALQAPRFSVELLRNDDGISLIGLVPSAAGQSALAAEVAAISDGLVVTDMLNEADFPPPETWDDAVAFGLGALKLLPRSKISIAADAVAITAIAGSEAEKRRFETDLARARPAGLSVTIDISAPRPVLTPFTLRFVKDAGGARFDACSADTDRAREAILAAAVAAGVQGKVDCIVGLGVPTPRWSEAAAAGIAAIAELGSGTITFSDADVTLLSGAEVPQATFDRVVGELDAALPDVFSLDAKLPPKPDAALPEGPPELTAVLSPEGRLQVRGRLTDAAQRDAVTSFARARFGADAVTMATRLDPDLPDGWPIRVLAGLQALSELHQGTLLVQAETVEVAGVAGSTTAKARIAQTLSGQLGQGKAFSVDVRYDERLDPLAALPTPQECVADLNRVLTQTKVAFAPGSAEIEAEGGRTLDRLAEILKRCADVPMQIAGHTDSQGSEGGNLALSQARAEAVLLGLQGRRVPVGALTAVGFGESQPLEDNGTEAGREANRRIEFSLLNPPATAGSDPAPGSEASGTGAGQERAMAPDVSAETGGDPAAPAPSDQALSDPAPADTSAGLAGTGSAVPPESGQPPGDRVTVTAAPATGAAEGAVSTGAAAPQAESGGTAPGDDTARPESPKSDSTQPGVAQTDAPTGAESGAVAPPAASPADPAEPFVSAAPTEQTVRPRTRPASP
jgi:OmpA-OmpF porin, OOP family